MIADGIKQFHWQQLVKAKLPLPLECESEKGLDALLEESIRIERELVPNFFNETDLRHEFDLAVKQRKYCSVNATAVLGDPEWRRMFLDGIWPKGLTR